MILKRRLDWIYLDSVMSPYLFLAMLHSTPVGHSVTGQSFELSSFASRLASLWVWNPDNNETSRLACLYLPGSLSDRPHSCHCGPDHQPRLHSAPDLDGNNDDDGPDGDDGVDGDDGDDGDDGGYGDYDDVDDAGTRGERIIRYSNIFE